MNLHEYQAKEVFRHYGIPVPQGFVAADPQAAEKVAAVQFELDEVQRQRLLVQEPAR